MASSTWWTWVWVDSRSWWWTGRPGVLRFMGLQRVGYDWATKLNWIINIFLSFRELEQSGRHGIIMSWLIVKAMVFPVVMYGCENWIVKKAEHWGIDAFELWCWRRLLRVPWTARRSNHSILKEISPGCSLERLMLKLKLQYFGHLMWRVDSLGKTDAGRDWGQEEKGTTEDEMAGWHHRLDGCEFEWTPGVGVGQGGLACCDSRSHKESDTIEWLNWTEHSLITKQNLLGTNNMLDSMLGAGDAKMNKT